MAILVMELESGDTKLELVKWGGVKIVPKFNFQSQFSISKIIGIFLNFFSLKNTNSLLLTFFDNINF